MTSLRILRPVLFASITAFVGSVQLFAADFTFKDQPGQALDILQGGKLAARWMYSHDISTPEKRTDNYKPYLHVFDAAGEFPITKGPGGLFPHHRGIYIGWNKLTVAGTVYDRWHMKGGDQVQEKLLSQKAGPGEASFTALVNWEGAGKDAKPILQEERTIQIHSGVSPAYLVVDQISKLKAVGGETVLDGDPEHAGLQFRPSSDIQGSETVYLYPANPANPHKDRDYPWMAESFTIKGKKFCVAYLNHPENPKETAISAYRDYGRFGMFFKDTIPAGGEKTIKVRYVITEGEMLSADKVQALWNDYTGKKEATPKSEVKPAEKSAPPKEAKPKADEKKPSTTAGAAGEEKPAVIPAR